MAEIITEKELQADVDALVGKFNCPTEFDGENLQEFMDSYQPLDTVQTVPIFDPILQRVTVALVLKRQGQDMIILQRGKVPGD